MSSRRYLVLHGLRNHRSPEHWQYWLVSRLRDRGEQVLYPQLPAPDAPVLEDWLEVLRTELGMLGDGERIVLCHSLGCWLWLRHAETAREEHKVDRLLLVAPPGLSRQEPELQEFKPPSLDRALMERTVSSRPELACSDADPWCPEGSVSLYGDALGLRTHVFEGGGHLSIDDGFGAWPKVETWALTGDSLVS